MEKQLETTQPQEVNQLDFNQIIPRVRSFLDTHKDKLTTIRTSPAPARDSKQLMFDTGSKRQPTIVFAQDTAVELGHPSTVSANLVLWTYDAAKINAGQVHLLGKDLPQTVGEKLDFAQIVMLEFEQDAQVDTFSLESTQYLSNRLPGYMVRMVPNRLWARVSRQAIQKGLDFAGLGKALVGAYLQDFESVKAVEVVFITSGKEDVEKFRVLSAESKIISSRNKKLELVGDGEYECIDFDCNHCDEQPVCDEIREMVTIRKKQKAE